MVVNHVLCWEVFVVVVCCCCCLGELLLSEELKSQRVSETVELQLQLLMNRCLVRFAARRQTTEVTVLNMKPEMFK